MAERRDVSYLGRKVDKQFAVRSAQIPDGRRLWVVLEALSTRTSDTTRLRLSLTSQSGVTESAALERWDVIGHSTLSAAIDLTPFVLRTPSPGRIAVHLVDGSRRRCLRVIDALRTSRDHESTNSDVPHPDQAVCIVPAVDHDGVLGLEIRPMTATAWALRTSVHDGTLTVHGCCVPSDAPEPGTIVLSGETSLEPEVRRHGPGRWSASVPLTALAEHLSSDSASWAVVADGQPLQRRPGAVPIALRPRARWLVEHDGRLAHLSTRFRRSGALSVEITWLDPEGDTPAASHRSDGDS